MLVSGVQIKILLPYYLFPGLRHNSKIMKSADSLYLANVHVNVCQTRDNIIMGDVNEVWKLELSFFDRLL